MRRSATAMRRNEESGGGRGIETHIFILFAFSPFVRFGENTRALANNLKNSIHFYFDQVVSPRNVFVRRSARARASVHTHTERDKSLTTAYDFHILFYSFSLCQLRNLQHQWTLNGTECERNASQAQSDHSHLFGPFKHLLQFICNRFSTSSSFSTSAAAFFLFSVVAVRWLLLAAAAAAVLCTLLLSSTNLILNRQRPHDKYRNGFYLFYPSRFTNITYDNVNCADARALKLQTVPSIVCCLRLVLGLFFGSTWPVLGSRLLDAVSRRIEPSAMSKREFPYKRREIL